MSSTMRQRLGGLWALVHPGPSLVTALAYALFALLAAHGHPHIAPFGVTVLGLIAMQFAISALNDYCDRAADKLSHKAKPIALGVLPPSVALWATAIFTAIMVACFAPFGLLPLGIASAFLLLGFAYDLGVKSTPLGGVMLGIAFPLLPLLAWDLFATLQPAIFWTFPLGFAIGTGIHLADALPDGAADGAAGARGLTQVLGRHALAVCWLLFAAANALMLILAITHVTPARPPVLIIAEAASFAVLLVAMLVYQQRARPLAQRLQANFLFSIIIALTTALGWLASAVL